LLAAGIHQQRLLQAVVAGRGDLQPDELLPALTLRGIS
jgi:hypothetical protein